MSQILTLNGNVVINGNNILTAPESTSLEANKNVNLVGGTTIVEPSTGYDAMGQVTANVSLGSLATPTIQASTGIVTASVQTAGYIATGSSTQKTLQLTTKSAQTYTPTTSDQTITAGRWLTGTQTIKGDANLVAGNIKKDVSIFGVTGTYEVSFSTIRTGSSTPASSLGVDGDIYIQTS